MNIIQNIAYTFRLLSEETTTTTDAAHSTDAHAGGEEHGGHGKIPKETSVAFFFWVLLAIGYILYYC